MGVYGGMEAFALALADWLARQPDLQVRLCFKMVAGARPSGDLVARIQMLGLDATFPGRASPALLRLCRWADIVHGNNASPDIVLAAKLARRPLLLTIHNYLRDRVHWRNRLWYVAAKLGDWRTYNSNFVRHTWEGESPRHDSEVVPTVSHLPRHEVPVSQRRGFFFAARLIANKGLETLVEAYRGADLDKYQWPLVIAGDGPLRGWLEQQLAGQGVHGMRYAGFVSEAEKALLMASARWLVAPPNTREDMGLTPIEARNVSVPAIVSRDGGLPEAAGPAAMICEPGDAQDLRRLLEAASRMPADEYELRSALARASLQGYLLPLDHYLKRYRQLVKDPTAHNAMTAS